MDYFILYRKFIKLTSIASKLLSNKTSKIRNADTIIIISIQSKFHSLFSEFVPSITHSVMALVDAVVYLV